MRLFPPLDLSRPKGGGVYLSRRHHLVSLGFGLLLIGFGEFSKWWCVDFGILLEEFSLGPVVGIVNVRLCSEWR